MTSTTRFQTLPRSAIYLQVAEQIRKAILDGSLSSGERLPPERELTRQFGVSRTTIREALRQLEAQGLLAPRGRTSPMHTGHPGAAAARFCEALTHVVQLEGVSLPDLIEMRTAIESVALTRAAAAPIRERLEEARAALAVMDRPEVQPVEFRQADVDFHVALVAASGNRALHLVMLAVKDAIRLHLGKALRSRSFAKVRPRLVEEHRAILKAVERGAGQAAANHLRQHLGFYAT